MQRREGDCRLMKERKYIRNGFEDIRNCMSYMHEKNDCHALREPFCKKGYDCPFFKDKRDLRKKKEVAADE